MDLGLVLGLPESIVVAAPVLEVQPGGIGKDLLGRLKYASVVVSGVLVRSVHLRQREGALLHGPGDVLAPIPDEPTPFQARSRVLAPARLAVLDPATLLEVAADHRLVNALSRRVAVQADRAVLQTVVVQLPSVAERLTALLPDLSDRVGTMTSDGVALPAYLSHTVIAALIGVRRPSLTTALGQLESQGLMERLPDRRWRLAPAVAGVA